ncbi:hypothetical protein BHE90_011063 [Fusarium euwallaceae]|uniref:Unsaturated glucuronyl hydrolase n=2 Tax=Fusarium solani species complex TaxID=232080 RepID=A0A3M2RIL2_9HYPO|nr:hypothetical protein CDV36_014281 [Fusarium kuroshium]RTE74495.1 hypothetical protein BHE90_011063 [Fusarium euwallaceae]
MSEEESNGIPQEPPLPEATLRQEPIQPVAILQHQASLDDATAISSRAPPMVQPQTPQLPQLPLEQPPGELSSLIQSPQTQPASDEDSLIGNSTPISSPTEPDGSIQDGPALTERASIGDELADLYGENILAKIYRTATKSLVGEKRFPDYFPEYVPQEGEDSGNYVLREAEFWTCGFFPGTLSLLLERSIRFPRKICISNEDPSKADNISIETIRLHLQTLCDTWARPLHQMAGRTDTHDIGFIVMPSLRLDWELNGNVQSLNSIIRAARSLATRYVPTSGAIRSWDLLLKKNLEIRDQTENMILIIDSLCNLDLLYYAAEHCPDGQELYDIATSHAHVLLRSHLREERPVPLSKRCYTGPWYSTCHVANIDPRTGELKARLTHQGYDNESTWARGQAWAILGYAQTFMSTKDRIFVRAACGLAEYFLYRLETAPECLPMGSRCVPLWDFDAPIEDSENPLRDSSAGSIAANGLLVLSQAMAALGQDDLAGRYRRAAIDIVRELLGFAQAPEKARLVKGSVNAIEVEDETLQTFDGILKYGTANNNQYSKRRYANHGLVYGDYYLVAFGNRLLQMGLV